MNSGKLFREQMVENFEAIEQAINDLDKKVNNEVRDRDSADNKLSGRIDSVNDRCRKIEQTRATRDEVEEAKSYMDHKAERVSWGSDGSTFVTMLTEALKDTQMKDLIKSIIKGW